MFLSKMEIVLSLFSSTSTICSTSCPFSIFLGDCFIPAMVAEKQVFYLEIWFLFHVWVHFERKVLKDFHKNLFFHPLYLYFLSCVFKVICFDCSWMPFDFMIYLGLTRIKWSFFIWFMPHSPHRWMLSYIPINLFLI